MQIASRFLRTFLLSVNVCIDCSFGWTAIAVFEEEDVAFILDYSVFFWVSAEGGWQKLSLKAISAPLSLVQSAVVSTGLESVVDSGFKKEEESESNTGCEDLFEVEKLHRERRERGGEEKRNEARKTWATARVLSGLNNSTRTAVCFTKEKSHRAQRILYGADDLPDTEDATMIDTSIRNRVESVEREIDRDDGFISENVSGFQTAKGSAVFVTMEKLLQARQLLNDDRDLPLEEDAKITDARIGNRSDDERRKIDHDVGIKEGVPGFRTAKGSAVVITKEKLRRAQRLLRDDGDGRSDEVVTVMGAPNKDKSDGEERNIDQDGGHKSEKVSRFQTTKGSTVFVTKEKLLRAQRLLRDDGDVLNDEDARVTDAPIGSHSDRDERKTDSDGGHQLENVSGFQTAKGSAMPVAKEKLLRAQRLLHNDDDTLNHEDGKVVVDAPARNQTEYDDDHEPMRISRFQTAKGSAVSIAKDAIARAKTLLGEVLRLKRSTCLMAAFFRGTEQVIVGFSLLRFLTTD